MSNALLSLTIEPQFLSATITERNNHIVEVVQCFSAKRSSSLSVDLEQLLDNVDDSVKKVAVAIGSDDLCFYKLSFPFSDKRKISQVIIPELEEQTTFNLDDYFFEYIITNQKDGTSNVHVALIRRKDLLDILNTLQEHKIDPDSISIAGLNIPKLHIYEADDTFEKVFAIHLSGKKVILSLWSQDRLDLIRQTHLNHNDSTPQQEKQLTKITKQTLLSAHHKIKDNFKIVLSGDLTNSFSKSLSSELKHPITICKTSERSFVKIAPNLHGAYSDTLMGESLAQAKLIAQKKKFCFNFRSGTLVKKRNCWRQSRVVHCSLILCTLLSTLFISWAWIDHKKLTTQRDELKGQVHQIFRETLPKVSKIVNPVQQLHVALSQQGNGGNQLTQSPLEYKILELLSHLSKSIPTQTKVIFTRLSAEQQNIRIQGEVKDFNGVDKVQKHLHNSKYFSSVIISSANLNSKKSHVIFELKLMIRDNNE